MYNHDSIAIDVQNLHFSYSQNVILKEINLQLLKQRFSVVLGRNGSGKSTLFNLLTGIYPLQQGTILVNGQPLSAYQGRERAKQLGFLTQQHHSIFNFKVIDVIMTGRAAYHRFMPSAEDRLFAEQALEMLEIQHLCYRDYTTLSGGERQLVMIARILTQNPQLILLDEPTNHLDVYYQAYLMEKLKQLTQQGYTIVSIMHDPNLAFLYADDFYFIKQQQLLRPTEQQQVNSPDFLQQVYDLDFERVSIGNRHLVVPKVYDGKMDK